MLQRVSVNTEERLQTRLNPQINTCGAGTACRPTSATPRTRTSVKRRHFRSFTRCIRLAEVFLSYRFLFLSRKLSALLSSLFFIFFLFLLLPLKTQPGERKLEGQRDRRLNSVVCDTYRCCSWQVCLVVRDALVVINPPSWPRTETICFDSFLRCLARPFLSSLFHFFFIFSLPELRSLFLCEQPIQFC